MSDFLASFSLAAEPTASSTTRTCASLEELRESLRSLLATNSTETRAVHVSTVLQLRDTVQFQLNVQGSENEALAGLSNLDPSLGGLRSTPTGLEGGESGRIVNASETLRNQSESDPVLQKAVARQIVATISEGDGSTWTIREVSRHGRGWTFTYHCKDSVQQWIRQNAKASQNHVIGDYYLKDPDPILDNRPAFDCRGTLTVNFPRNGRSISVKYEHTPMHKTVAQLKELFKPPPRPQPPAKTVEAKTPKGSRTKAPKEAKVPNESNDPTTLATDEDGRPKEKRKRPSAAEGGKARKRKKKSNNEPDDTSRGSSSLFVDHEHPTYDTPSSVASKSGAKSGASSVGQSAAPATSTPVVSASAIFPNVTPAEAARRKEVAIKLLTEAGILPATLSEDQFSIFANQSPELQKDSLAMLLKYGAERLRIVQPPTGPAGQQSTPTTPTQPSATGAVTTKELVPQTRIGLPDTSSSPKSNADAGTPNKTPKGAKLGKSRLVCYQCKERRVKCSKERPSCEECIKESRSCGYPPQPPRAKAPSKRKSEAIVVQSDEEEEDDDDADKLETRGIATEAPSTTSEWPMPVAEKHGPTIEPTVHNPQPESAGFHQPGTGLSLQEASGTHASTDLSPTSGMAHLHNYTHRPSLVSPNPLQQPHSGRQEIATAMIQNGNGPRASVPPLHPPGPSTNASPTFTFPAAATHHNTSQLDHRRTTSTTQRERVPQSASSQVGTAAKTSSTASPSHEPEQGRARSRQGQRGQTGTPTNKGVAFGAVPGTRAQPSLSNNNALREPTGQATRYSSQATRSTVNDGPGDNVSYQPYSRGHTTPQGHSSAAISLPTTGPSTTSTSTSYPSTSAGKHWDSHSVQDATHSSFASSNAYGHMANSQRRDSNMNLGTSGHQQPQNPGHRGFQNFGSQHQLEQQQQLQQQRQQQQQQNPQQMDAQQQHNWFGAGNTSSSGSINSFGQCWP